MKFLRENTSKGLRILPAELKLAGFSQDDKAEVHVLDTAIVVLGKKMTAFDLIDTARQLNGLAAELSGRLANACGLCDDCGEGCCPYEDFDFDEEELNLPDYLREEAGIPEDAKLCAVVDEENGTVTIMKSEHEHDLRDVPPILIDMFVDTGLCLGKLEELLMTGGAAYEG